MTNERYMELETDLDLRLTVEEMRDGWHLCMQFDYLLTQGEERDEFGRCVFCEFDGRKVTK